MITIRRPSTSITIRPGENADTPQIVVSRQAPQITVKRDGSAGPQGPQGPAGVPGRDGAAQIPEVLDGGNF